MNKEKDFLKEKTIKDKNGEEWEICSEDDNNDEYEYNEIEICSLENHDFTFDAIQKFIDQKIKTNIHFIYSKMTHNIAVDILNGVDVWNGKVDIKNLNAVIFLLFKPHGAGKNLDWIPTKDQIKEFASHIFSPKSSFKVGMDSCLVNHVLQYGKANKAQEMTVDTCEAARMSAYITPDMKFMPCSFADESVWSLPIENNLHAIWQDGSAFVKFRKMLLKHRDRCPLGL